MTLEDRKWIAAELDKLRGGLEERIRELRQEMHDGFDKTTERFMGLQKEMREDFREVNQHIDTDEEVLRPRGAPR